MNKYTGGNFNGWAKLSFLKLLDSSFDFKVCISCQMKNFFLSHTTCRKYFLVTGKKFLVSGRIFLSQEEISCLRRNFLALEEISCHRKKLFVKGRNFMPQLEISCHSKNFFVRGRNVLSQKNLGILRKICNKLGLSCAKLSQSWFKWEEL